MPSLFDLRFCRAASRWDPVTHQGCQVRHAVTPLRQHEDVTPLVVALAVKNSGWHAAQWSVLAACVTAGVAVLAAAFAYFQVREARNLRRDQAKPFVIVDIQPSRASMHLLNLVVENTGTTIARDVTFVFEPPLSSSLDNYDIAQTTFVKDGLPMIPPRRRHEYLFDSSVQRHDSNLPMRFEVIVRYSDKDGKAQEPLRFPIDLSPLYGIHFVEEKGLHHLAKSVDELAKTTKSWAHRGGLRAWTRDEDAHDNWDRAERALTGSYGHLGKQPPPETLVWLMTFPPLRALYYSRGFTLGSRLRLMSSCPCPVRGYVE
jgi:hypothetical protein